MPGGEEARAMRMKEGEDGRERCVIVNYIGEIGHTLVAFVERRCEDGIGALGSCGVPRGRVDGVETRVAS